MVDKSIHADYTIVAIKLDEQILGSMPSLLITSAIKTNMPLVIYQSTTRRIHMAKIGKILDQVMVPCPGTKLFKTNFPSSDT